MSSGEADAFRGHLDAFRRCAIPGCDWRILGDKVCYQHGGKRTPQYVCGTEGEILRERFMPK